MKAVLNPDIADRFEIVGEHRDHVVSSYGTIRFSKLSEKYAEALIADGCPFIRRKEVKPSEPVQVEPVATLPIEEVPPMRRRRKLPTEPEMGTDEVSG